MLQFWKKSGSKEKSRSSFPSPTSSTAQSNPVGELSKHARTESFDLCRSGPLASFEDEGLFDLCENEMPKQHSRLSKTLDEVLEDKAAFEYFVQYLEARGGLTYLHCWLDLEQFKLDVQKIADLKEDMSDMQTNNLSLPSTRIDHDSLSVSTDCDSYTADSYSLCDTSSYTLLDSKTCVDLRSSQPEKSKLDISYVCDISNKNSNDTSHTRNEVDYSCSEDRTHIKVVHRSPVCNKLTTQRLTDDALRIFKTYLSLEASESIKCPEELRKEIIENVCDTCKILNYHCFEKVERYIHNILDIEYFQGFLGSDYFCRHQIDVLTSGNIVLDDVLYNETALFYFMEFLEQENNRSLLEFWIAASNFQMQLNEQKDFFDPREAQNDAVVLYDKYFSLQAHCPLGFSDKIRFAVEQSICGESGIMLDCFHLPLKIVEQVLEKNYLKPFVTSQLFYKYLSELIHSVHTNGSFSSTDTNKYATSDCSSERSFSTNTTFLAMKISRTNQRTKKEKGNDMSIDTRQLYDPDSLWKRKTKHRLSLGRITSLGKYETDFEPEPDTRVTSRLKTVVKKFMEEDKKKEEMAWQVAEMIVKDITSITLQEQKGFQS